MFEAAGGYAPTIGIIGAVLGLIQVMKNLENIEEVGHGIAVAFVATVYGVASANMFFPAGGATSSKRACTRPFRIKELMLEGVAGIVEGLNPKLIRMQAGGLYARATPTPSDEGSQSRRQAQARLPAAGGAALKDSDNQHGTRQESTAAHENHERWLVSYADFITLLFAFFVVMFASSQTDKAKAKQVSESVKEALENGGVTAAVARNPGRHGGRQRQRATRR